MMRYILILITAILMGACSPGLKVYKKTDNQSPKETGLEYRLPKNKLDILFTVKKTKLTPGPFAKYAKQYLEIAPNVIKESEYQEIVSVEHQLSSVKDTSNVYLITGGLDKISAENWLQLNDLSSPKGHRFTIQKSADESTHLPDFTERTLKKIMIEESKSSYKTVVIDSTTRRIPITNTVLRNKSEEEIAKDAAKTLRKIRKRKLRLIGAINEKFPKSGDIRFMIEKLEQEEQKYLELFMGKKQSVNEQFVVSFVPNDYKSYRLFNFSEQQGRIQARSPESSVILKLKPIDEATEKTSGTSFDSNLLPYRVPGGALLEISYGGELLYQTNIYLAQFGTVHYLPAQFLKQKSIKFDTLTGAVKSVGE